VPRAVSLDPQTEQEDSRVEQNDKPEEFDKQSYDSAKKGLLKP